MAHEQHIVGTGAGGKAGIERTAVGPLVGVVQMVGRKQTQRADRTRRVGVERPGVVPHPIVDKAQTLPIGCGQRGIAQQFDQRSIERRKGAARGSVHGREGSGHAGAVLFHPLRHAVKQAEGFEELRRVCRRRWPLWLSRRDFFEVYHKSGIAHKKRGVEGRKKSFSQR